MTSSPILNLPGEIRNQIYRLLLLIPFPATSPQPHHQIHPLILSVCRQTHQEALLILYGENTFIANESMLTSMPRLRKSYRPVIYPRPKSLIRRYHLIIRLDCDARFEAESATRSFSGMEILSVEAFQAQFGSCDFSNLRRLEMVRAVERVTVSGSTNAFPAYARWLEQAMMTDMGEMVEDFKEQISSSTEAAVFDPWGLST